MNALVGHSTSTVYHPSSFTTLCTLLDSRLVSESTAVSCAFAVALRDCSEHTKAAPPSFEHNLTEHFKHSANISCQSCRQISPDELDPEILKNDQRRSRRNLLFFSLLALLFVGGMTGIIVGLVLAAKRGWSPPSSTFRSAVPPFGPIGGGIMDYERPMPEVVRPMPEIVPVFGHGW